MKEPFNDANQIVPIEGIKFNNDTGYIFHRKYLLNYEEREIFQTHIGTY